MSDILYAVLPALTEVAITVVISLAGLLFVRLTGRKLDAEARAALHSALTTGAEAVMARQMSREARIEATVAYAEASVPGAIRRLKPARTQGSDVLRTLAEAKIAKAAATQTPSRGA